MTKLARLPMFALLAFVYARSFVAARDKFVCEPNNDQQLRVCAQPRLVGPAGGAGSQAGIGGAGSQACASCFCSYSRAHSLRGRIDTSTSVPLARNAPT